ncbi:hypothetical protein [Streptomyces sp. V4I2]|uniref:hypothetical protein n=1 Tax=Streptomyces sp. V4I2 TaxID=3042280 RepID=UPI00278837D3|nr:hypothetical protein [Streptomyces sp. V4I2]
MPDTFLATRRTVTVDNRTSLLDLADGDEPGALQQAFIDQDSFQCGSCTPSASTRQLPGVRRTGPCTPSRLGGKGHALTTMTPTLLARVRAVHRPDLGGGSRLRLQPGSRAAWSTPGTLGVPQWRPGIR